MGGDQNPVIEMGVFGFPSFPHRGWGNGEGTDIVLGIEIEPDIFITKLLRGSVPPHPTEPLVWRMKRAGVFLFPNDLAAFR